MSTPVPQDISNFPPPDPIIDWPAERWAEFGGAQLFEAGSPFDLEYTTLRFSGSSYSYCKTKGVRDFPYDPVGGIELHLGDDSVIGIDFSNAFEFPFFGTNHTVAAVSSNGFLSFLRGDYDHSPTILDHYRLPRISALFADLYPGPGTGASISWKQFGMEAVAVTYRDVPAYKQPRLLSSFQIAMHSSGEVMLTWLGIQTTKARLAGLSSGRLPPELGSADLVSDLHPGRCSGTFGLSVLLCPEEQELRLGVVDGQLTAVCYRLDGGETGKLPCDFTSFKIRNNGGDIWAECETAAP